MKIELFITMRSEKVPGKNKINLYSSEKGDPGYLVGLKGIVYYELLP